MIHPEKGELDCAAFKGHTGRIYITVTLFFKAWVEERTAYQHNKDNFPKPLTDISPE